MFRIRAAQAIACILACLALGCSSRQGVIAGSVPVGPSKVDPWILICTDPAASEPAYLSNGWFGVRIGRDGTGLPGEFFPRGSKHPYPNPLAGHWSFFDLPHCSHYLQSLDMRTGILTTSWDQPDAHVTFETVLDPGSGVLGQQIAITAKQDLQVQTTVDRLNGAMFGGQRLVNPGATLFHNGPLRSGETDTSDQEWSWGNEKVLTFDEIRRRAALAWAVRWQTDILIDGPSEDQQAIHSWLFYLRSSMPRMNDMSPPIGPMGLSSDLYKRHQFWDADTWIFPALAILDPSGARAIPKYRLDRIDAAIANAHGHGIRYPWESWWDGYEVGPPESADQQHITGDVAFMLWQAAALGLADEKVARRVGSLANQYYHSITTRTPDGLAIESVRGPDEYHHGNNDLYTNALAQWLADRYAEGQGTTNKGGTKYVLPHDSVSLLTYDNDPVRTYGQADAILAIYPLQNATAEAQAKTMMERFPPKTSPSSPAMTDSVEALIWARLNEHETAYRTWRKSWQDFMDHPLGLFSEERRKDRTYFLTGAAGCLQTVLYGFLGFRIDWKKDQDAVWASRLHGNNWASFTPHLPSQWKSVTLKNFYLLGHAYTLVVTHNRATVLQGEQ